MKKKLGAFHKIFLRSKEIPWVDYTEEHLTQKPSGMETLEEHGANLAAVLRGMKKQNSQWLPDLKAVLHQVVSDIKDFEVQQVGGYLVIRLFFLPILFFHN
ncbi:MAG: hypothetical protein GX295_00305 [Syntrophomonadaceae bacterium]|nr:hypothetical protein [Syntrophomonadaceae bacterium]